MDLDIEMSDAMEANDDAFDTEPIPADDILQPDEPDEPGEIADDEPQKSSAMVPTKLYIRGLDSLHTDHVKAYVKAHFRAVGAVEWIDDSSANLVFDSPSTAREALAALSSIQLSDTTALEAGETLPAKPLDERPDVSLQVRFSLESDKKRAGAALRSRYYLLHPEHDPEEKRRHGQDIRSRYRDRDDRRDRRDRRDRYDRHDRQDRRDEHDRHDRGRRGSGQYESESFEASMYDDVPRPQRQRRYSEPEEGPRAYARNNREKELFKDRRPRRDRSASPRRRDDDSLADRRNYSSRGNRDEAQSIKNRMSATNKAKELFPGKISGRGGQLDQLERSIGSASLRDEDLPRVATTVESAFSIRGHASRSRDGHEGFSIKGRATSAKELFPEKLGGGGNAGKELLDMNTRKQRQKAQDLFP
ncbi:hypothetical protein L249_8145 [Ophiocordyceps polyrhachis-furcata BCC 54312]|uniref:Uncharacterized protein n=1 Tax=Ophiocordyceps polyrhachis-furcata BCC 54312 TaxID=1330021 RepID=A0A367LH66_9HYPO|nr:hypothetical protein L249_8145 [Ophiocordyceps polyrhachis-furcata BCC 54312]